MGRLITGLPVLEEHNGALHFGTDVWSSPNHKAYVAVTVHFEESGKPVSMLLDLVRVAQSTLQDQSCSCIRKDSRQFWYFGEGKCSALVSL